MRCKIKGRAATSDDGTFGVICLMYLVLIAYLDRVNISTAVPAIGEEFGFDQVTMGVILSVFLWAYAIFQVLGGWVSDRFACALGGHRRLLVGDDRSHYGDDRRAVVYRLAVCSE